MPFISFITANFIARECGYHLNGGWEAGQPATQACFRPPETFEARFDALLAEVRPLGFAAVDIWTGHLSPAWATPGQMSAARRCLERQGLQPVSVAFCFGSTLPELEAVCRLAAGLGAPILRGVAPVLGRQRAEVVARLRAYGTVLAIENHTFKALHALIGLSVFQFLWSWNQPLIGLVMVQDPNKGLARELDRIVEAARGLA